MDHFLSTLSQCCKSTRNYLSKLFFKNRGQFFAPMTKTCISLPLRSMRNSKVGGRMISQGQFKKFWVLRKTPYADTVHI